MNDNTRKALYRLIPFVMAAFVTFGLLTDAQAALVGTTATGTVGLTFALSRATGNRFLDAGVRRALYGLIIAAVAAIGGWVSLDVALWTSLALGVAGSLLAILNVDPDEQTMMDAGDGL